MTPAVAAAAEWAAGMAVWTALLLAAARIADRLLAGRVAARARMLLYAALLVRLALPLRWEGGVAVEATTQAVRSAADAAAGVVAPAVNAAIAGVEAPAGPSIAIVSVYAAGLVVLATVRLLAARRLSRGLRPARESLRQLAPGARMFESDGAGPAVVGVLRPAIVLPSRLADTLDPDALGWVVRHERAHLAARDPLLLGMLQALVLLLWPVVPLWIALRRVRTLMELACDDRTLAGVPETRRRDYMRTLLEVVDRGSFGVRGGALGFGNAAAERLRAIGTSMSKWPRVAQWLAIGVLTTALVACTSQLPSNGKSTGSAGRCLLLLHVTAVDSRDEQTAPSQHVVESRLIWIDPLSPLIVRSKDSIECSSGQDSAQGWIVFTGEFEPGPAGHVLAAPSIIANDGDAATIEVGDTVRRPELTYFAGLRIQTTVRPTGDGLLDMDVSFEWRGQDKDGRDDVVLAQRSETRVRLREGQSVLLPADSRE